MLGSLAALRLVGLFIDDWRSLELARRARGVADRGRLRRFAGQVFALLVLSIRRGSKLATAMEARGFGASGQRTWAREASFGSREWVLVALGVHIHLLAAIVAGMIIAGSGSGLAFRSGLTTLADACVQQLMGQVVSSYFAVAYLGLSIPVVGTGLVLTIYGPTVAVDSFAGFICVVIVVSAVWSHAARPQR